MLGDAPLVAFVPTSDLRAAQDFYGGSLGLHVEEVTPYAVVLRARDGVQLRVTKVDRLRAQPFTVLGWVVDDLRAVADDLAEEGIAALLFDGLDQDEQGVWTTPSGDRILWFHDPDGNVLSVTSFA